MHTCALNPTHSVLNEQSCPSAARPGFRVRVWRIIPATRCHVESFAGPIPDQSQQDRRGGLRVGLLKLLGDAHMESMLGQAKPGRAAGIPRAHRYSGAGREQGMARPGCVAQAHPCLVYLHQQCAGPVSAAEAGTRECHKEATGMHSPGQGTPQCLELSCSADGIPTVGSSSALPIILELRIPDSASATPSSEPHPTGGTRGARLCPDLDPHHSCLGKHGFFCHLQSGFWFSSRVFQAPQLGAAHTKGRNLGLEFREACSRLPKVTAGLCCRLGSGPFLERI